MLNLHLVACVRLITMPEMMQVIVRERERLNVYLSHFKSRPALQVLDHNGENLKMYKNFILVPLIVSENIMKSCTGTWPHIHVCVGCSIIVLYRTT